MELAQEIVLEGNEGKPHRSQTLLSAEPMGLEVSLLEVEVHCSSGLPRVDIVGLAETCVRESKQRVRAAILASGLKFPDSKITINLVPPSVKKTGTGIDLAIALGILLSDGKIKMADSDILKNLLFLGECSLSGKLRPIKGILNVVLTAREKGLYEIVLPIQNAKEASLVSGLTLFPAVSLNEVIQFIERKNVLPSIKTSHLIAQKKEKNSTTTDHHYHLANIKGQSLGKDALILAVSGGHNLLFVGPPGSGKTLLAKSLCSILPKLSEKEAMEVTRIHSCAGILHGREQIVQFPPFRFPHHSISDAGFIGGGKYLHPGELSLAHHGVLFLDELPEFKRNVLESLREPLESGMVILSRAQGFVQYPAQFQLVAAMNPCPCGYWGSKDYLCRCSPVMIRNYTKKISGPLLDRIDIRVFVHQVSHEDFFQKSESPKYSLDELKRTIQRARERQKNRYQKEMFWKNAEIPPSLMGKYCVLTPKGKKVLMKNMEKKCISARAVHRILRLAKTLGDLKKEDPKEVLDEDLIYEALNFWQISDSWN